MPIIAENHLQFILEVGVILFAIVFFAINLLPTSISIITLFALILSVMFALLFGIDTALILIHQQHELVQPFGSIAILSIITAFASLRVMENSGVNVRKLKTMVMGVTVLITVLGGLMHRSFLLLWFVGLFVGFLIISKSFRQKSILTLKRIAMFLGLGVIAFVLLEVLSQLTHMSIFSPLLRISRIGDNSIASIKMVLQNTYLIGHNPESTFWKSAGLGFADGYITLPMSLILMFGLPLPLFFGVLVTKKDQIDYFLPGIMGYTYDFGYLGLVVLIAFIIIVILVGLKLLMLYREKRERNNKTYLGKEVLLIGSLTAFISQSLVGLFISNRSINGIALISFIVLASLVLAHTISIKREQN
ncbi:MAG: hypothetical protein LBV42_04785 [Methanobrevibacter sp.]|jgi:hypothetical protein|nr:hypothetical protein [Methanobrevibacter sp.]